MTGVEKLNVEEKILLIRIEYFLEEKILLIRIEYSF